MYTLGVHKVYSEEVRLPACRYPTNLCKEKGGWLGTPNARDRWLENITEERPCCKR